jgi:hypothetical protein
MYVNHIEARSRNHCCRGKVVSITYSECLCGSVFVCVCVCSLIYREFKAHARIILSSLSCPALQYSPHYLINGTIFGKKVLEHEMYILIFSTIFV